MLKKILIKLFSFAASFMALLPLQAQVDFDAFDAVEVEACSDFYCEPSYICRNRFWLEADYLYWQVQNSPKVIPLVIEQPVFNGPFDVVLGGKKIKNDWHSGAKFALGYWFDENSCFGAEVSYFFLGKNSKHSSVASDANGSPRLRVPYFDVTTGLSDSSALASPGIFRGAASLKTSNTMQGLELNVIREIPFENASNFKVLAGFRYWNFKDNLRFSVSSPLVVIPTVYNYQDQFCVHNNFYGGQLGACFMQSWSSFFLDVRGQVALGAMCQKSTIAGHFQTNEFTGSVQIFDGGFFALPTNIGHSKKTRFSVIPELDLNMGYQISDNFSIRLGYSALYASEVLRAAKQISSHMNPTQSANIEFTPTPILVGVVSPKNKLRSTGLWVQGWSACLDYTF